MKNKQTIDERIDEILSFLGDHWSIDDQEPFNFGGWKEEKIDDIKSLILDVVKEAVGLDYMDDQTALHNGASPITHYQERNLEKHQTLQRAKEILGMEK